MATRRFKHKSKSQSKSHPKHKFSIRPMELLWTNLLFLAILNICVHVHSQVTYWDIVFVIITAINWGYEMGRHHT